MFTKNGLVAQSGKETFSFLDNRALPLQGRGLGFKINFLKKLKVNEHPDESIST